MKTFAEMKTNVGRICDMDTSTPFLSLAGGWLNDRYLDAWNRYHWSESINDNYTLTLSSGTAEYPLPLDFALEINVVDITDGFELERYTERLWWKERAGAYSGGTIQQGVACRYRLLLEKLNATGTGFGVISFDPTPNNTHTIAMPYKRSFVPMITLSGTCTTNTANKVIAASSTFITSGVKQGMRLKNTTDNTYGIVSSVDSETQLTMETDLCPDGNESFEVFSSPIISNIEYVIECGAISDGLTYKKQYAKAGDYLQKYEYELGKRISEENRKPNQRYQWIPERNDGYSPTPFTGWNSYDSI
jgi:hypothetical protein